jgi:7,8-dihydropterin-6-yl-methyl-4-(beta-D-ribofuranosyl)aminobenzene 5'-phosphate synthase
MRVETRPPPRFVLWLLAGAIAIAAVPSCNEEEAEMVPISPENGLRHYVPVSITITYDNNAYDDRLETAWGFSCVVQVAAESILFDTGGDGSMLLRNMEKLGLDPSQIDLVVLSHIHSDHAGGLESFLKQNSDVVVYVPASFPQSFKDGVTSYGARLEEVRDPRELLPGVHTTGELDGGIKEQSLVVETKQGLVVITGCAHPGVVNAVRKAKEITGGEVHLVLGGFHLGGASTAQIESVVESFVQMGVEKVAPCHCTGEKARSLFHQRYGDNYIESGVGKRIVVAGGAED